MATEAEVRAVARSAGLDEDAFVAKCAPPPPPEAPSEQAKWARETIAMFEAAPHNMPRHLAIEAAANLLLAQKGKQPKTQHDPDAEREPAPRYTAAELLRIGAQHASRARKETT